MKMKKFNLKHLLTSKHLLKENDISVLNQKKISINEASDIQNKINMIYSFDKKMYMIHSFNNEEIGSKMSSNFISLPVGYSVKDAMSLVVKKAADNDNVSVLYLVDDNNVFCGALELKDLIIAREGTNLTKIAKKDYPYLYAETSVDDAVSYLKDYAEDSVPILDNEKKLLGVVTSKDFMELLDDELNDDYAKVAGLSSEEDLSEEDLKEPIMHSVKKRLPWLLILLVLGLGVSATVGLFQSIVAQLPVIMCFQSLILDMAGNVGTQSLAVAIRVLMDSKLAKKHKLHLVRKEAGVGLINGFILGILSFIFIGLYLYYFIGNDISFSFAVSGCLGVSMTAAMLMSAFFGTLIPLFFKKIGIDPAVASGPLITTVNDLVAVVTYYGLAWLILLNILPNI